MPKIIEDVWYDGATSGSNGSASLLLSMRSKKSPEASISELKNP